MSSHPRVVIDFDAKRVMSPEEAGEFKSEHIRASSTGTPPIKTMRVGFTGTRKGMTNDQKFKVREELEYYRSDVFEFWFLHGNCVGSDEQALHIATSLGYKTRAYPTDMPDLQIPVFLSDEAMEYAQPLTRNRRIVRDADVMIATPKESVEPASYRGSGTWFTINHCRKQNVKRTCLIIWPNGRVDALS